MKTQKPKHTILPILDASQALQPRSVDGSKRLAADGCHGGEWWRVVRNVKANGRETQHGYGVPERCNLGSTRKLRVSVEKGKQPRTSVCRPLCARTAVAEWKRNLNCRRNKRGVGD